MPQPQPWPLWSTCRHTLLTALAAVTMMGCGDSEGVGSPCDDDADCGYGLQCFVPAEETGPVCTISCQQVSCDQGICIEVEDGTLCVAPCAPGDTCAAPTHSCQLTEAGEQVCWYVDPFLDPLPEGLMPSPIQVRDDDNGDGILNPGERATVDLYVENFGTKSLTGLWAELVEMDQGVEVQNCKMPGSPSWLTCSELCSCHQHALQSNLSVAAGAVSSEPLLSMEVQVSADASGTIEAKMVFHDALGRTWERPVDLTIVVL